MLPFPLFSNLSVVSAAVASRLSTDLPPVRSTTPGHAPFPSHAKSFGIRTYEKHVRNPFRIRTSKTQDLKPFGMNTYEKTPGADPYRARYLTASTSAAST